MCDLPCPNLLVLQLYGCHVDMDGILDQCTFLTRLNLYDCTFTGDLCSVLASLTALVDLRLQYCTTASSLEQLPPLSKLTCLHIARSDIDLTGEQTFPAMPNLQSLSLIKDDDSITTEALAGLVALTSLTELSLDSKCVTPRAQLGQLTWLISLRLEQAHVDPDALSSLVLLTQLHLLWVQLLGAGAPALLSSLAHLQDLQDLQLCQLYCEWPPASPAYAALTASSRLQSLQLLHCDLPAGVWQHVFWAGQQLPALWNLGVDWKPYDEQGHIQHPAAAMCSADIEHMVNASPNLQDLMVQVDERAALRTLRQLPAGTDKCVGDRRWQVGCHWAGSTHRPQTAAAVLHSRIGHHPAMAGVPDSPQPAHTAVVQRA